MIYILIYLHIIGYEILPEIELPKPNARRFRNISRLPIPEHDDRLIMWEVQRRPLKKIKNDNEVSEDNQEFLELPDHLREEFNALEPEKQKQMNDALQNRNGLIVEYNELISALLGCNSNVGLLGSEEQSKSSLCYLLKYVTKQNTGIIHSASLILHARRRIEQYPSVAEDTGSAQRTAMHLLNRVTNKISCAVEISANMAALALLGAPAEFVSCPFQKAFVHEAASFSLGHPKFKENIKDEKEEFQDLLGDEWIEEGEEEYEDGELERDENDLTPQDLYDEDFNPRLLECLGEEDCVDRDLR